MSDFIIHVTIMSGFYALLALSLNLQAGFGGLMNFGQIALFACGAYGAAIAFHFDFGAIWGFVAAVVAAGFLGWVSRASVATFRPITGALSRWPWPRSSGSSRRMRTG